MLRWIQVTTLRVWTSQDGDNGGTIQETHTIKVDDDCEDLKEECKKKLAEKGYHHHGIKSYKFV